MKKLTILSAVLLLSSCDYFENEKWQNYYQTIGVEVTGGSTDESAANPFGGAFGDDFNYHTKSSSLYWGEDGASVNTHYRPYSSGNATQYYRGTDEHGAYGKGSTGGY